MLAIIIPDAVWQAGIAGCVTVVLALIQLATKRSVDRASRVATVVATETKVQLVEATRGVDTKLAELSEVAATTHALVNSNMGIQLKLHAVTSRRLADLTRDPADISVAETAEKLSREHDEKQAAVDNAAAAAVAKSESKS